MKPYNSYSTARKEKKVKPGLKVMSYPNHKGEMLDGIIYRIKDDQITVEYDNKYYLLDAETGKLATNYDSSVDINLIEVDD